MVSRTHRCRQTGFEPVQRVAMRLVRFAAKVIYAFVYLLQLTRFSAADCCLMFSHRPSVRMSAHVIDQTIQIFPDLNQQKTNKQKKLCLAHMRHVSQFAPCFF